MGPYREGSHRVCAPRWEATDAAVDFQGDGIVTGKRTFQKFFTQEELRQWIEQALHRRPVAAAPGVFYVFRDETDEQSFAVNRVSRHRRIPGIKESQELVADHKKLIEPLMAFVNDRGRLPVDGELFTAPQLTQVFGSVARAFSLLRRLTGTDRWDRIRQDRRADVLVYLALAAFPKRPRSAHFRRNSATTFAPSSGRTRPAAPRPTHSCSPPVTRMSSIKRAVAPASASSCPTPLRSPHRVDHLPPVLRVYEGCGRQLAGTIDGLTLVKLYRRRARLSYLAYEDFDSFAHPALQTAIIADLKRLHLHFRDYARSSNPPVLHRKELFVPDHYPRRRTFANLTAREDALGLLQPTNAIGTRAGWMAVLAARDLSIIGHRIVPLDLNLV